ncbi:hypothetical protein PR001_g4834 [Phytophthora rubi]|uniref:ZSWIM1/3 RNaseH-like domain-containing protein n=1 Tax=Phytophthora rubi TaxID=129364 RepID=A0A6A3NWW4_9STRA|nr:hypothetical protein PR001_g4834 [Phytophthora rubi]
MKDVHNLIARLEKEAVGSDSLEKRVENYLIDFATGGNYARMFTNTEGVAEVITLQTAHMRSMFESFPEIVLIDATHDTNKSNYKLFSFMIHDAFDKGYHVQHSLIGNEKKETLRTAIRQFKEACPTFDYIACIMVDKDFTEIAVLEEEFPSARVLLCHFHVVQCLHREVANSKYNFDAWTKNEMRQLCRLLISAPSERIYNEVIEATKVVIRNNAKQDLWFKMLDNNWTPCKTRWSSIHRGNIPHMGNQTNNRGMKCVTFRAAGGLTRMAPFFGSNYDFWKLYKMENVLM